MTFVIKCDCGRGFPFNPEKHRRDKVVYCPHCRRPHENTHRGLAGWKPNLNWIRNKIRRYREKQQAKQFLDTYFGRKIGPDGTPLNEYLFPLGRWMKGNRPTVTVEKVREVLGKNTTETAIQTEIDKLQKLGVKVRED